MGAISGKKKIFGALASKKKPQKAVVAASVIAPAQQNPKPAPQHPTDLQERVEESKFYVGPSAPQVFKESEWVFPQGYGQDKVILMVRDPYWMHSYWEITSSRVGALKAEHGEQLINSSRLVLRLLDVNNATPEKPNGITDMDVAGGANNWYIQAPAADSSYCVEIGFLAPGGRFLRIARSNVVHTPRGGVSDIYDEQWMTLEEYDKIYGLSGGLGTGLSSGEIRKQMRTKLESPISSGGEKKTV